MTEFTPDELKSLTEHRVWPRFLLFPTVAILGSLGFAAGWGGDSLAVRTACVVALGYCWFCVGGSFHEAVHQTIGRRRQANVWYGRIVGTLLGIPYTAYRETHIRHHAYMNTPDDWELWPYSKPSMSLTFRRAFVWFDIFGAVLSSPIIYGRIYFKRNSPLSAAARATLTREYLAMAAFWSGVVLLVESLALSGSINLNRFDPMWLLPLPIACTFNTLRKFTEHLGMASTDPIFGTRTVIGSSWVTRLCSYFNFELFVHGPHHRFPRAPHHQLESKLADYQRRHSEQPVPVFSTYLAAMWDMLPCLWRNPGVGENSGGVTRYHVTAGIDNFTSEIGADVTDGASRRVA